MSRIEVFNNNEFGELEILEDGDKYWFPATKCAEVLGYTNPRKAILDHCKGVTIRDSLTDGGKQKINYISEGDLYRLIARSKLEAAQRFEKWVFDEVLPTIRKHGVYATPETLRKFMDDPKSIGDVFYALAAEQEKNKQLAEENRKLATPPSFSLEALGSGDYVKDLMHYYEDTVPGRSSFKHMISKLESYQGLQGEDKVQFYGNIAPVKKEETADADSRTTTTAPVASGNRSTETTTATTVVTEPEPDPVEIGDGIVLVDKRAISIYGGSFSRGEKYATTLNEYKKQLGSKVNVYSLVAPTAVSFYLPDSYAGYTGSEPDNIDHIDENLKDVKAVDAYAALAAHTDEDIYARTDHHWLPLGAYYAAEAFAKTANVSFAPLSGYTKTTLSGYLGSMYTFTKSAVLQENPEDFTYYTPHNQYTTQYYDTNFTNERDGKLLISLDNVEPVSWYLVFMGGDEKITHVKTDVTNKRTLVIVKDSYGNALVPYLTQSFSDIYVIDMRYFDLNAVSFMQQVGATDVLFAMNTFSATGGNSECLETIRTQ